MSLLSERDIIAESKGYWWKDRNFTHPQTNNTVGFKSLPLEEQKRLNDMVRKNSPEKFKPEESKPPEQEVKKKVVKKRVKPKQVKPEQPVKEKVKPEQVKPEQPVKEKPVKEKPVEKPVKNLSPVEPKEKQPSVKKPVKNLSPVDKSEKEKPGFPQKILDEVKKRLNPAQQHNLDKLLDKVNIFNKEKGVEDKAKAKRNKQKEFKDKHEKKLLGLLDRFKFDKKEKKIVKDIFSHIYSTNPNNAISLMKYLESLEEDDLASLRR